MLRQQLPAVGWLTKPEHSLMIRLSHLGTAHVQSVWQLWRAMGYMCTKLNIP